MYNIITEPATRITHLCLVSIAADPPATVVGRRSFKSLYRFGIIVLWYRITLRKSHMLFCQHFNLPSFIACHCPYVIPAKRAALDASTSSSWLVRFFFRGLEAEGFVRYGYFR